MKIISKLLHDSFFAVIIALLLVISVMCLAQAQMEEQRGDSLADEQIIEKPMMQYDIITQQIPIYNYVPKLSQHDCWDNVSKVIKCIDLTYDAVFDHYDYAFVSKKPKITEAIFKYPIGDRNMIEFGKCRQYEIDKGVCEEIK